MQAFETIGGKPGTVDSTVLENTGRLVLARKVMGVCTEMARLAAGFWLALMGSTYW